MITTERFSDGPQYACREFSFLPWLRINRPSHYRDYCRSKETGEYAYWLLYLWEDGDSHVEPGMLKNFVVSTADRRCYARTAIQAILDNVPFDEVDDFSEDSSAFCLPTNHDGTQKLTALLACVSEYSDVVYIGSGEDRPEQKMVAGRGCKLTTIDPCIDTGVLATYPFTGEVVVNDAFYPGFEKDQVRLIGASVYFAKQMPVKQDDNLFYLPGSSEARYTNKDKFSTFMWEYLARILSAPDRGVAVYEALRAISVDSVVLAVSVGGSMIVDTYLAPFQPANVVVPFREYALFMAEERVEVNGVVCVKRDLVEYFKRYPLTEGFRSHVVSLLNWHDSRDQRIRKKKRGGTTSLDPKTIELYKDLLSRVNVAMLRGISLPVCGRDIPGQRKAWAEAVLRRYKENSHDYLALKEGGDFVSMVDAARGDCTLLDFGCGSGGYTTRLSNVVCFDREDNRVWKNHPFREYSGERAVLFRHVLHHTPRWYQLVQNYIDAKVIVIIIEHDPRFGTFVLDQIHASWRARGSTMPVHQYISPLDLHPGFKVIGTVSRYNTYCAVWKP